MISLSELTKVELEKNLASFRDRRIRLRNEQKAQLKEDREISGNIMALEFLLGVPSQDINMGFTD